MRRKLLTLVLASVFLATVPVAEAKQPTKIPRIGFLGGDLPFLNADRTEAFRQGLRELGYVEGKNIVVEHPVGRGENRAAS